MTNHPFPAISNPQLTTTGYYSGDVMINLRDLFSDIDLKPLFEGWRPIIKTQFLFRSGKIAMWDEDISNEVSIVFDDLINHDGNVVLHIPAFTDDDDTLLLENHPAIMSNKVIVDSALGGNFDAGGFDITNLDLVSAVTLNSDTIEISSDNVVLSTLYRQSNTAGHEWGISFDANNSASIKTSYASIRAGLVTNSSTDEDAYLSFQLIKDGALNTRMLLNHDGNLYLRPVAGISAIFDVSAINTSNKTISFQNANYTVIGRATTDTLTNKILLDSGAGNQLGVNLPYTYTIYQEGSNYIVKTNSTGTKQTFANTDIAPALEWAANNATSVIVGEDSRFAGSAFVKAGAYNWITEADHNYIDATRHGFVIKGEGYGTTFNMGPASGTLSQGLKVGMMGFQIRDCRINLNSNIQRAIKLEGGGDGGPIRHDFPLIQNVLFQGPNGNDGHLISTAGAPVTVGGVGQRAIDTDGSVNAVYFGTIMGCKFISLDIGVRIAGGGGITSMQMINNVVECCNTGIYISGGQNSVNGLWVQGSTLVGKYGVHVASGGHNQINMVISELHKTDNGLTAIHDGGTGNPEESAAVKLDSGVGNTQIGLVNNGYRSQSSVWHAVLDSSGLSGSANSNHYSGNFVHNGLGYFSLSGGIVSLRESFLSVRNGRLLIGDVNNSINYVVKTSTLSGPAKEILLPALTTNDEFVFKNHAVEIFNKTINASNNTLSNIGDDAIAIHTSTKISITNKTQLPSSVVYNNQTNTFGAFSQFFSNNTLKILTGGAGTLTIGATSIGTSVTATIPALTSGDTFLFASHTATMTNKTYDAEGTGNVLTNVKDSNIKAGAAIAVAKLANGSANQHLVTNAAGTTTVWRAKTPFLAAISPPSRKNTVGVADTWVDAVSVDTASALASTSIATFTLNTTGADQYVVEMTFRKTPSVGTVDLRLVNDANGTDVLHTFTGVTDGRQTSTIAALPAWCLGANEGLKTLRVQVRSTTSTDDVRIGQFSVKLV